MASLFSNARDEIDLETRIAALGRELASLKKAARRHGEDAYTEGLGVASEVYDQLRGRFDDALPHMQRSARRLERGARDHPAMAAFVGIAVVGLLAALLSRR